MEWNKNLKTLRKSHDLSQQEIAEHIGVTQKAYSNYELGKREPDFKTLFRLARYYKVSLDYLVGYSIEDTLPEAIKNHAICKQEDVS